MSTPPFNVLTATATELQNLLAAGTFTSVQIIETYLAQIEKHNHAGAHLNAIISVAPRQLVLQRATILDDERRSGKIRSPLHGIPMIAKDCFHMMPEMGLKVTVGAYCFSQEVSKGTAEVIEQVWTSEITMLSDEICDEFIAARERSDYFGYGKSVGQYSRGFLV